MRKGEETLKTEEENQRKEEGRGREDRSLMKTSPKRGREEKISRATSQLVNLSKSSFTKW